MPFAFEKLLVHQKAVAFADGVPEFRLTDGVCRRQNDPWYRGSPSGTSARTGVPAGRTYDRGSQHWVACFRVVCGSM